MRRFLLIIAVCIFAWSSCPAWAAGNARPIVLIFQTTKGEGVDNTLTESCTKAVRNYIRETQKAEATVFNRESASVIRAIMEKKLTADKVASYSSQNERLDVASALSYDYAAGAEVSIKDALLKVKLWIAKVNGDKHDKWETTKASRISGTNSMDIDNAMQMAASTAVLDLARQAFSALPRVTEPTPVTDDQTTAISAGQAPVAKQSVTEDYASEAQTNLTSNNIALAIEQYKKAINAAPNNGALRLKLAEAYVSKGLYDDAERELTAAATAGADESAIAALKDRINKLRNGGETLDQTQTITQHNPPQNQPQAVSSGDTGTTAIAKMAEGDKLWRNGKPDEAAEAYKQATTIDPKDWHAWERLAVVNAWLSLFNESRKALSFLGQVQPTTPPETTEKRYDMLRAAFDVHFATLLKQYDTSTANFEAAKTSRESYYNEIKGLSLRLESMASFLDIIPVPPAKTATNLRRSLACGLMAQAASSLLNYLETNSEKAKSNAATFASQAKSESQAAGSLEGNNAAVTK